MRVELVGLRVPYTFTSMHNGSVSAGYIPLLLRGAYLSPQALLIFGANALKASTPMSTPQSKIMVFLSVLRERVHE